MQSIHLSPSYKGFETQQGELVSSKMVKKTSFKLAGPGFLVQTQTKPQYFQKKRPLFKESCNIKNMQLYHNSKKTGEYHWGLQQP